MVEGDPRVHVLHRPGKQGLGGAYITGFKWALASMDCALPLRDGRRLLPRSAAILPVSASASMKPTSWWARATSRASTSSTGPSRRLILSITANVYTRVITGLPLTDATAGFKCFRRAVLEALAAGPHQERRLLVPDRDAFHAWKKGFRIVEVPIIFTDRRGRPEQDEQAHRARSHLDGLVAPLSSLFGKL